MNSGERIHRADTNQFWNVTAIHTDFAPYHSVGSGGDVLPITGLPVEGLWNMGGLGGPSMWRMQGSNACNDIHDYSTYLSQSAVLHYCEVYRWHDYHDVAENSKTINKSFELLC